MKFLVFPLFLGLCAVSGQSMMDDPVVVTIEGRDWRRSEIERFAKSLPPAQLKNFEVNKKGFLEQFALTQKLARMAMEKGLDKQDPHQYRKLYADSIFYATAMINEASTSMAVPPELKQKFYDEHKSEYQRAKVKVLYLSYAPEGVPVAEGQKKRSRAEAQSLADALAKRAKAGEDFAALVKANSDDAESRDTGGDYPEIKPNDPGVPPEIKATVFALKPGEVSDAVALSNGFYVFRMEKLVTPALSEINDEVVLEIQRRNFDAWMKKVRSEVSIQYKDERYFSAPAPAK